MVRPLGQAVELAESVAAGDLSRRIEAQGRDEPARLLQSLDRMCHQLGEMVAELRQGSLRMASACAQIHAGNLDLKGRTTGHLDELGHVRSNLVEVTGMIGRSAQAAEQAAGLVESVEQAAQLVRQEREIVRLRAAVILRDTALAWAAQERAEIEAEDLGLLQQARHLFAGDFLRQAFD